MNDLVDGILRPGSNWRSGARPWCQPMIYPPMIKSLCRNGDRPIGVRKQNIIAAPPSADFVKPHVMTVKIHEAS